MTASRDWTFEGVDGGSRAARTWSAAPSGTASGSVSGAPAPTHVVLLAHGYGEHLGRYGHVAEALVAGGAVVSAVDHLGHGRSAGERALVPDLEDVVTDLHALDERARADAPGLPVALVGHSMGGLVAARYAQRYGSTLAALVLSGPVVGAWRTADLLLALDELPDLPLDITTLSRDPDVGREYAADPLVWHGPFRRPTLEAFSRAVAAVQDGPSLGSLPLLWVHGTDDPLVPLDGTRPGIEHLRGEVLEQRLYEGAKHEVFNETNRDEVLADVTGFLRRTLASDVQA